LSAYPSRATFAQSLYEVLMRNKLPIISALSHPDTSVRCTSFFMGPRLKPAELVPLQPLPSQGRAKRRLS
jgi:hypothetical protein